MTEFYELTTEQQREIINKLADLAVEIDLDIKVVTTRELVCNLKSMEVIQKMFCRVKKEFPIDMKAKAAEYNEKAKAIYGDTKGVEVNLFCPVKAGDSYDTITKVKKMGEDAETEIVHK